MDGEERERKMLEDQIARARAAEGEQEDAETGLQKPEGEKIKLSFAPVQSVIPEPEAGPSTSTSAETPSEVLAKPSISIGGIASFGGLSAAPPVQIVNPLKRPAGGNVFKSAKVAKIDRDEESSGSKKTYVSEAERLMKEDLSRKANRSQQGYSGFGPRRGGGR